MRFILPEMRSQGGYKLFQPVAETVSCMLYAEVIGRAGHQSSGNAAFQSCLQ